MDDAITDKELAQHLTEMLDSMHLCGKRLMIDREGQPIASCRPRWRNRSRGGRRGLASARACRARYGS